MAHPYTGQAQSSQKRRLRALGASAGKPYGSSSMYKKRSYPKKNAGRDVGFTIPGGKAKRRADRMANGGAVRGAKHKPHHTTNIVISAPGGAGGRTNPATPVPVNRPVPVPVRPPLAAAPPVGGGIGAPGLGGAPPVMRPPLAAPALGARPPLPGAGGLPGMKSGGVVKKAAGGYAGSPHSPTTDAGARSAVSPHRRGGSVRRAVGGDTDDDDADKTEAAAPVGKKKGGAVKKRQLGGGAQQQGGGLFGMPIPGRAPVPAQQGPPTLSGRPARPAQPLTVPMPATLASYRARPAPGTTVGFKKGGKANRGAKHADEAEDRKLIKRMLKSEEKQEAKKEKPKKRQAGGSVGGFSPKNQESTDPALAGNIYHNEGVGFAAGGIVNSTGGAGGGKGRLAKSKVAAKVPDKTEA